MSYTSLATTIRVHQITRLILEIDPEELQRIIQLGSRRSTSGDADARLQENFFQSLLLVAEWNRQAAERLLSGEQVETLLLEIAATSRERGFASPN